ncbi:hypothetical protein DFH09DRAFT_1058952 [Mycena vulgaris]|nr:hypothetical protein DFH09DRAFT_1058952 [Mycena vulgaris]
MGRGHSSQSRFRFLNPKCKGRERFDSSNSEEYAVAMGQFYARHLCRMDEIPAPIMEGFGWIQKDPKSSVMMTGTSAFKAGGALKNRSMIADAHKIAVPTLLLNGWYDQAQDSVLASFVRQIPRVESVTFEEANHMIHFEERERYMQIVGNFLVRK